MNFLVQHPAFLIPIALIGLCVVWIIVRRSAERQKYAEQRLAKAQPQSRLPRLTNAATTTIAEHSQRYLDQLHRATVARLVGSRHTNLPREAQASNVRRIVEHQLDAEHPLLNRIEHEMFVVEVVVLLGFGPKPPTDDTPPSLTAAILTDPNRSQE